MHLPGRRAGLLAAAGALAAAGLLASASPAFAPHVAHLILDTTQVKAGGEITVFGQRGYGSTNPVEVRFDSPEGPVLGSFQPNNELYALWGPGAVTIPADASTGTHTLFATQVLAPNETHIRGIPARAEIQVLAPGGAPVLGAPSAGQIAPEAEAPASGLVREDPVSTGSVVLVGLGVAGVAMLVAGAFALSSSRREPTGQPAGVTK